MTPTLYWHVRILRAIDAEPQDIPKALVHLDLIKKTISITPIGECTEDPFFRQASIYTLTHEGATVYAEWWPSVHAHKECPVGETPSVLTVTLLPCEV